MVTSSYAQQIDLKVIPATCANNGVVQIEITESTNYDYLLVSECGDTIPPQNSPIFTALKPCIYTIDIKDKETGHSRIVKAEITSTYKPMELEIWFGENCSAIAEVSGGTPPYTFRYSNGVYDEAWVENRPSSNPDFSTIEDDYITIEVRDSCGNTIESYERIKQSLIRDHQVKFEDNGIRIIPEGGKTPYQFEVTDGDDSEISEDGFFSWNQLKCDGMIRIRDKCGAAYQSKLEIGLAGRVNCTNFSEGTVTLSAINGIPPFKFEIVTTGETLFSEDGVFTYLPKNNSFYNFYINDACGNRELISYFTRFKPDFSAHAIQNCLEESLTFSVDRQCSGVDKYPVTIQCLSCEPVQEITLESGTQQANFIGNLPGQWEIAMQDDCGDKTICRDELKLELIPACDSIIVNIIDFFKCDNKTTARRVVEDEQAIFTLFDEQGNLIEDNNTKGVFKNLGVGNYQIIAVTTFCDTLTSTVKIREPRPLNVALETTVYTSKDEEGNCVFKYDIDIEQRNGPFILTGGPDGSYFKLLNDYGEDNCLNYHVYNLLPGTYYWKSLSRCGIDTMILPVPEYNLETTFERICEDDSSIRVFGGRTQEQWLNWYEPFELNVQLEDDDIDNYDWEDTLNKEAQKRGTVFYGLPNGEQRFYVRPFSQYSCPVDSLLINIPNYEPPTLSFDGSILCDNEDVTDLNVNIEGGQSPYRLDQLNCIDGNRTNRIRDDLGEFVVKDLPIDNYCFVARDGCGVTNDFQVNVSPFKDSIEYDYSCEGQLTLRVDSLPATYQWVNETGVPIGKNHKIVVPNPQTSFQSKVQVQFDDCTLERVLNLLPRTILPSVSIEIDKALPVLCGINDTIELSVKTDGETLVWNSGDTAQNILVTSAGFYLASATNDLGCTASDTIQIVQVAKPSPKIFQKAFCANDSLTQLYINKFYPFVQWSTFDQSAQITVEKEGLYFIEVEDENRCRGSDSIQLKKTRLIPDLFIQDPSCFEKQDGMFAIDQVVGGKAPYSLYIEKEQFAVPWEIGDLPEGEYNITIIDSFLCKWDTLIQLKRPTPLSLSLGANITLEFGDSLQINPITNFEDWKEWEWTSNGIILPNMAKKPTLCPMESTIYRLMVASSSDCIVSDELEVKVIKNIPIYRPTVFSPNGDGNNDYFMIYPKNNTIKKINYMRVFDRFGNQVFTRSNLFAMQDTDGWDGKYQGNPMPTGVYAWAAEVIWKDNRKEILYGDLTLIR